MRKLRRNTWDKMLAAWLLRTFIIPESSIIVIDFEDGWKPPLFEEFTTHGGVTIRHLGKNKYEQLTWQKRKK